MPYFFNGRLHITPTVVSQVDDSAMFNRNPNVGNNLALIGKALGGQPNTLLRFGNPDEAREVLIGGDLCDAVVRAFDPSAETAAPQTVTAVRVDPATQSGLTLKDGSASNVITLASQLYGLRANQIKVKIEAGSTKGLKITTQLEAAYFAQDNIYRDAFQVRYSGSEASGVMSITNTTLTLQAPSGTTVASIDLATYDTVQKVVDRINAVTNFSATVLDGNGEKATLAALDTITTQDIKTANYTATANLQAAVDWFNGLGEGFVTATRVANAGTVPAAIGFTYLTGAVNGSVTNTEWNNGFETLQGADVQWVVPLSDSASIHAMADAHVAFMSNVSAKERRAICGTALATSDANAITAAKELNSDRTSLVHIGVYDYNAAGVLTLFPPYIAAAMLGGAFAGVNPGVTLTNKSLKVRGLERKLRVPTDTDLLIEGGVLCLIEEPTGYRVAKAVTTWLTNDNYNRVEMSTGVAVDYVARAVRQALADLKGAPGNPRTLARAVTKTETALGELARPEPIGLGVIVGDETSPAYRNIIASLEGDVLRVQFECSPVIPVNYVAVTIFAQPFSGSLTA